MLHVEWSGTTAAVAGGLAGALWGIGGILPDRLAALGRPVLVIFGTDDKRWRSWSAAAYRVVPDVRVELLPGVGHTPMMEDRQTTGKLLLDFAAAAGLTPIAEVDQT